MALATSCHSSSPTLRRHGRHISAQRCERPQAAAAGGTNAAGPGRPRTPGTRGARRADQDRRLGGVPRDQLREPLVVRRGPRLRARPGRLLLAGWLGHGRRRPFVKLVCWSLGRAIAFSTRKEVGTPNCTGRSIDIGLDPNQTPGCSSSVPCELHPPTKLLRWIQGCNLSRKNRISTGFQNRAISPPASTKMSKFCALVPGPGPAFNGSPCGLLSGLLYQRKP